MNRKELQAKLLETLERELDNAIDAAYVNEGIDEDEYLTSEDFDKAVVKALSDMLKIKRTLVGR